MKSLNELNRYYFNLLRKDLLELEKQRKPIKMVAAIWVIILAYASYAGGGFLMRLAPPYPWLGYNFLLQSCFAVMFWLPAILIGPYVFSNHYQPYVNYKKIFKEKIIRSLVNFIDEDLVYKQDGVVPLEIFMESSLFFSRPDDYSGSDYVKGIVGQTKIEFSEVYATKKSQSDNRINCVFQGLVFVADFNKNFVGKVSVHPDNAESRYGSFGRMLQSLDTTHGQLINLEDPEFEKLFVVYGSDQVEARYVLSPALMSRITAYRKKCKREVSISFVGSKIYVTIKYKQKLFTPRIFRTLLDFEQVEAYYRDLELIVGIVEQLKLNTRIWSKQ